MLDQIRNDTPGVRFIHAHQRNRIHNPVLRVGAIFVGLALMVAAAVTFWLPGPNFVLVLAGLALVAAQWRLAARLLDWLELRGRAVKRVLWDQRSKAARHTIAFTLWTLFTAACLAAILGLWHLGLLPAQFTDRLPDGLPFAP
jgi:hypothetical protein